MSRKIYLPSTILGLRAWLKGTEKGRELLGELTENAIEEKCRACENIRSYPKVLVVLRRLGRFPGAEVYAEEGVSVRFLELPDTDADLEEYIEARLPENWRCLLGLPAKRIRSDVFRGVSLAETLRHTELGEALREIRNIKTALTGGE